MPNRIQVDPSRHGYIGIAARVGDDLSMRCVRPYGATTDLAARTWRERLAPDLNAIADRGPCELSIELPPVHIHKGSGREGAAQVRIGRSIGRAIGMLECWAAERLVPCTLVEVDAWRSVLSSLVAASGVRVPSVATLAAREAGPVVDCGFRGIRAVEGKYAAVWVCGATRPVQALDGGRKLSTACPVHGGAANRRRVELASEQHKATAVTLVRALWPDLLVAVVADRATTVDAIERPWRIPGVADACEALLQLVHVDPRSRELAMRAAADHRRRSARPTRTTPEEARPR